MIAVAWVSGSRLWVVRAAGWARIEVLGAHALGLVGMAGAEVFVSLGVATLGGAGPSVSARPPRGSAKDTEQRGQMSPGDLCL